MRELSKDEKNFLLKLNKPSYIKSIPAFYDDKPALWLIENLSTLVKHQSVTILNSALDTLNSIWINYVDENIREEFQRLNDGKKNTKKHISTDAEPAIEHLKHQLHNTYPTSLDRFKLLNELTNRRWLNPFITNEPQIDFPPHVIAAAMAIDMLGVYINTTIQKDQTTYSYQEVLTLSQAHQAYFLANELLRASNEKNQLSAVYSCLPKRTLSMRGAAGGKAKSKNTNLIKQKVLKVYSQNKNSYRSKRQAASSLVSVAHLYAKENNLIPLAPTNAQRTIYDWLRRE